MPQHHLQVRLDRFAADRTSGAAELAREAAAIIVAAEGAGWPPSRVQRLRDRLARAHPAMASVWNTVRSPDPSDALRRTELGQRRAIREVRRLLRRRARVVTLSYSSTVASVLARRDLRVTVGESRPGNDGRDLARRRQASGLETTVVPDAILGVVAREADCAVIGADAITPRVIVNKVGSRLLALACRDAGVPLYVVADPSKRVPPSWPIPPYGPDRPFETVPRRLVTRVLDGVE